MIGRDLLGIEDLDRDEMAHHNQLVRRVSELAEAYEETSIYIVVDSMTTEVDPDSLHDAEAWLRALWPWLKERR